MILRPYAEARSIDGLPAQRALPADERAPRGLHGRYVYPAEEVYEREIAESGNPHHHPAVMEELKSKARELGLWNLFLPDENDGAGLSNADYAPLAEVMGRSHIASEACNCSAPDTGNMEVLHLFATEDQREKWLVPLLEGEIRSAFAMTEPAVASSDATNIEMSIVRDGDEYVLNGRKWWTSNALHPNCRGDDRDGQDGARCRDLPPAEHDPRADGHARSERRAQPEGLRLRRPGGPRRSRFRQRPGSRLEPDRERGRRVHDRAGPPGARAHPPLHAGDRRGRAGARADVQASGRTRPRSANRSPRAATSRTGSPSHGSKSTWRVC